MYFGYLKDENNEFILDIDGYPTIDNPGRFSFVEWDNWKELRLNNVYANSDESATFEDKNNVLANYTVNCSEGIKCETNGNKLKVTALSENKAQTITFTKKGDNKGKSIIYGAEKQQTVATSVGKIAPVSCEFGVDTYKQVQTSDAKIVMVIMIAFMGGALAYVAYYTKKSLNEVK